MERLVLLVVGNPVAAIAARGRRLPCAAGVARAAPAPPPPAPGAVAPGAGVPGAVVPGAVGVVAPGFVGSVVPALWALAGWSSPPIVSIRYTTKIPASETAASTPAVARAMAT